MIKYIVFTLTSFFLNSTWANDNVIQLRERNEEELCKVSNITESTEIDVNYCIEAMASVGHKDFKEYTYESLKQGFASPALEIYSNKLFKDSEAQKKKYLYSAAYLCYEPAYFLIFELELANKNIDAFLWAMLIEQNTSSYDNFNHNSGVLGPIKQFLEDQEVASIGVGEVTRFFGRFNCADKRS